MMIEIPHPTGPKTVDQKINFATEVAFGALLTQAAHLGLPITPCMGLMYVPDADATRAFQEAARAVLGALGVTWEG